MSKNKIIFISGTPCTGKTTIATKLADKLTNDGFNCKFIKINDFAIANDFVDGEDPDKFYKIINIEKLDKGLNKDLDLFFEESNSDSDNIAIVEGHLSHLCNGADKMIVLRLDPNILKNRLNARNYSESKVYENCEAEALAVCSAEAYEIYGEDVSEIDCGDKSVDDVVAICLDIINGSEDYPIGYIDFMDWILTT
ncbi:MAG: adenylate kinase family protein [Methanobacteriaceae archaeon]|nr:adenylate kinase family protein [Methanobacteriaceae archaeon]